MSRASDQPMEMQAELSFIIDRNQGLAAKFVTTFVVDDPSDVEAKGMQMQEAISAFISGYGAGAS